MNIVVPSEALTPLFAFRFWTHVAKEECWVWIAARDRDGYGRVKIAGKTLAAHRVSWVLAGNSDPEEQVLDHVCGTKACVRPDHLEPVTNGENIRRGFRARSGRRAWKDATVAS